MTVQKTGKLNTKVNKLELLSSLLVENGYIDKAEIYRIVWGEELPKGKIPAKLSTLLTRVRDNLSEQGYVLVSITAKSKKRSIIGCLVIDKNIFTKAAKTLSQEAIDQIFLKISASKVELEEGGIYV